MLSMTGFGRGEAAASPDVAFTVEVSSVNRKQFELRFLAPPELNALESVARRVAAKYYSRGAIQLRLHLGVRREHLQQVQSPTNSHKRLWLRI